MIVIDERKVCTLALFLFFKKVCWDIYCRKSAESQSTFAD